MKLCFSTLGCFERSLENIVLLARKYNIDFIEFRGTDGVLDNTATPSFSHAGIDRSIELLRQSNVVPLVLGTSCSFHNADKYNRAIEEGVASIRLAQRLGCRYIRVFGDKLLWGQQDCTERVIAGLSALCDRASGVEILLEVHGDFNTVEALSPILDKLSDKSNFGLIWDIEHTHKVYGAHWADFYTFARPYIKHVHIKDYSDTQKALTLIGEGDVPIGPIVQRLRSDGYDGCFSLEWEKKWHPELPEIETAMDGFLSVMQDVSKII